MWQKSSVLTSWPSSFPFHQHLSQTQKQQWSPRHQGLMPNHNSTNVFPASSPAITRPTLESPFPCRKWKQKSYAANSWWAHFQRIKSSVFKVLYCEEPYGISSNYVPSHSNRTKDENAVWKRKKEMLSLHRMSRPTVGECHTNTGDNDK